MSHSPTSNVAARVRALLVAGHLVPSLAISALVTALAVQAAPHGIGRLLAGPAMLVGQLSIGWSNDVWDASRDAAAGRTDKPVATGAISARTVMVAAWVALVVALGMAWAISVSTAVLLAVIIGAAWAYNLGVKSTWASGLAYVVGFGPIPAYAASTLPGQPMPPWSVTVGAALVGLGGHFTDVLPDLVADRATGVAGLPQRVAARWGPGAVRTVALVLLLSASVLLVVASGRRWVALIGLAPAALLAVVGARGSGRLPFAAAFGIAAVDVVVLAVGGYRP
ncbi:UbiA family prenyltransferase [Mycolicibacterium madagascariense]|uniref:UbiA family prenyltransferase n=1 Tax=Mycolicibacterium madagascariense TaxID=212765 RepID=UPI0013D46109|nr:UbiA family prenyltransferase [Mycolicibacterium madagascariense]MCV7011487.1 UbiA family prenyltransferase [Mycolicibacterium madagascariense]